MNDVAVFTTKKHEVLVPREPLKVDVEYRTYKGGTSMVFVPGVRLAFHIKQEKAPDSIGIGAYIARSYILREGSAGYTPLFTQEVSLIEGNGNQDANFVNAVMPKIHDAVKLYCMNYLSGVKSHVVGLRIEIAGTIWSSDGRYESGITLVGRDGLHEYFTDLGRAAMSDIVSSLSWKNYMEKLIPAIDAYESKHGLEFLEGA